MVTKLEEKRKVDTSYIISLLEKSPKLVPVRDDKKMKHFPPKRKVNRAC